MQQSLYLYIYMEKNERKEHKLDVFYNPLILRYYIWEPDGFVKSDCLLVFHKEEKRQDFTGE